MPSAPGSLGAPILTAPVLGFSYLLRSMSLTAFGRAGAVLGRLLYLLSFRKSVVSSNLCLALGEELSAEAKEELTRNIYKSLGRTFLEIARNFSLNKTQMQKELHFSESDKSRIQEILDRKQGIVLLSAHIANWELLAMGVASHGIPTAIVVKKMNSAISQALIERQRQRTGLEVIYSGGAIEKMKVALKAGKVIGFMMDQNTTGKKGIRCNFFGVPASSIRALSAMVRDTGAAVIPICAYRKADGTHEVHLGSELPYLRSDLADPEERRLREEWINTQQYQGALEAMIRRKPEQWLWIHRRWKTSREPLCAESAHLENR